MIIKTADQVDPLFSFSSCHSEIHAFHDGLMYNQKSIQTEIVTMSEKLYFASDYMEGALPAIMNRLAETNLEKTSGYGTDHYSESARRKIRELCNAPAAEVQFLVGGTQVNEIVITSVLRPYQGVIAAETGHIAVHEAGAIEAGGHKVLTVPESYGKISAQSVRDYCRAFYDDANHDHMVMPGMVYISQPTEYGTLYSLEELSDLHDACREFGLSLYADGARLAYALACKENDVSLSDLARLCDVFYIGGTKCGALFGEAVVFADPCLIPHFFTIIKQRGALVAKGRITGLMFDTLFTDGLYVKAGETALREADRIRAALKENGYRFFFETPTNQIFIVLDNETLARFGEKCEYSYWEKFDENHTVIRLATSWAASKEDTDRLIELLRKMR